MKVAIIAGEASGDQLGAGLIVALREKLQSRGEELLLVGLGGPKMITQGFESIAPMEWLSVMGIVEPLKRLPLLFKLRSDLFTLIKDANVDVVIGIDSPDFNLGLERKLKALGIPTCHYVCPSVWAWRQRRVYKIRRSVDHVLTLLPFEQSFLKQFDVPSTFVGHPVADQFARAKNNEMELQKGSRLVCVMPGSRHSELDRLLDIFVETIKLSLKRDANLRFIIPSVNESIQQRINAAVNERLSDYADQIVVVSGDSHQCMQRADSILMSSGTATLEAGLLAKPMVVAYRMGLVTYWLAKLLVKLRYISLPNLLLDQNVVPEFIQGEATPKNLSNALLKFLNEEHYYHETQQSLQQLLPMLAVDANTRAADAVIALANRKKV